MDVSQQWPLTETLRIFDFTSVAGINTIILSAPPSGFHELIIGCFFGTNTSNVIHIWNLFKISSKQTNPSAFINLARVENTTVQQIAFIGSFYEFGNPVVVQYGLKNVYIPFPWTLQLSFNSAGPGEIVTLRTLSMRLPGSQPFQALFNLL